MDSGQVQVQKDSRDSDKDAGDSSRLMARRATVVVRIDLHQRQLQCCRVRSAACGCWARMANLSDAESPWD